MKRLSLVFLAGFLATVLLCEISTPASTGANIIVTLRFGKSITKLNEDFDTSTFRHIRGSSIYLIHAGHPGTAAKLRESGQVESAEEDFAINLSAADSGQAYPGLRTDAAFLLDGRTMTNFYGTPVLQAYARQAALSLIQVDRARSISIGAGTRVAYIDTGVDPDHPALRPWLEPGVDVLSHNGTGSEFDGLSSDAAFLLDTDAMFLLDHRLSFLLNRTLDSYANNTPWAFGHGTLVAGIIHVVAPGARIVPIKAFDAYGRTTLFSIIEGVYAAIDRDVDVLNLSFSTSEDSATLRTATTKAASMGIAVVASAGNDDRDASAIYPASFPEVYAVAATDLNDHRASFSNYGKDVSVTAPGAFVVSTVPGGRYAAAWGTSFSAPIVSGSISLLAATRSRGHANAPLIKATADSIDAINPGFERKLGSGRVNVGKALEQAR